LVLSFPFIRWVEEDEGTSPETLEEVEVIPLALLPPPPLKVGGATVGFCFSPPAAVATVTLFGLK
jgi:hypothetical protein